LAQTDKDFQEGLVVDLIDKLITSMAAVEVVAPVEKGILTQTIVTNTLQQTVARAQPPIY
jgi:hypothetical protein